jgi:hypothetical protein
MVRVNPPADTEYWGSYTSDLFFLTLNLVRVAERNKTQYREYAGYAVAALEEIESEL